LWVLSSIGFLLSSISGQMVSAVVSVGIYFAGHLSADIYNLAQKSKSGLLQVIGKAVYYFVPNLERVNFRAMAAYDVHVPFKMFLSGAAYSMAYSVAACVLAILIFNRRDFR